MRQSTRSTRIDLRLPNDLLETIQNLAADRFNAPIHHISGKPEITPVIIHLIRLGINALSEDQTDIYPFSLKPDQTDTDVITRDDLARAIASLRAELVREIASTKR
ncbi:MAG: hypothetical protein GPI99_14970 [Microcystis aeruginosa W13-15]|jgi:hypothetical protein|nr:hypothetical protein [Microcystis aeruginosa W13-16]NCQ74924.1 hypothetical protein [Microcystis aeruginosa W13-13]NCQ79375.1 hypothetical protein [Microcystis aeruginosa W13-15]NCS44801.1 hypothetical protein [Microcystis aeruginosa BS11-05]NCT51949.1 hypothetical protein [Microcystis aeruginosa G13-03]